MTSEKTQRIDIPVHGTILRLSVEPPRIDPDAARYESDIHRRIARAWQARRGHKRLRVILADNETSDPATGSYSRRFVADIVYDVLLHMLHDGLVKTCWPGPLFATRAEAATKLDGELNAIVVDVASLAQGLASARAAYLAPRVEP